MDHPEVFLTDNPDEEARWLIDYGLGDYNAEQAGYWIRTHSQYWCAAW